MNTQHTPGPWKVKSIVGVYAQDGSLVASLHTPISNGDNQDARLIAAAPELLEALQAFLRAPSVGSDGPGSSTIVVQDFNLRAARAAIVKATGGQA